MLAPALAFLRWTALAYPRAFGERPATARCEAQWGRASRAIAARVALACVRERLVDGEVVGGAVRLAVGGGALTLPLRRVGAFDLHTPDLEAARALALEDPIALLRALAPALALDPIATLRIEGELRDSTFNLALALLSAELRAGRLAEGLAWPAPLDPENLVVEGHPWHPMCRTRLGLSRAEVLAHAPEHLSKGTIDAVDVDRQLVTLAGDAEAELAELFPPAPRGWLRLPVHRAQRRRLPRLFADLWGPSIRPAPVPALAGRSLLSLRTIAIDVGAPRHVKLALDVVTTSARRTVSAMSVANGPPITRLLAAIQAADPAARGGLQLLGDRGGAGLRGELFGERAAHLGVILRGAPERLAAADGEARGVWVCAALGERRPAGGRTLLQDLAARHASADELLARYVDLLVPPSLRLLSAHGIALELHLQNSLAVVGPRGLAGFVVRDLGGLRIHRGRLAAAGHALAFAPGSFIATDDLAEVRDKVAHTLFHAHLAALFRWAERDLGIAARRGWAHLRACLDRSLDPARVDGPHRAAATADHAALVAPRCRAKALLRMRMDERISDYAYTDVANVLADAAVIADAATIAPRAS